jgi:UDP-glucose 4-epimerase
MRYLITGGAGFIGGHLVEALLRRGDEVLVIDDMSTGDIANLAAVSGNPKLEIVVGDVLASEELERLVAKADVVIHLAAAVGVELVVHDPVRTIVTNVHGTERVLRLAAKYGRRTVIASTSEVYGKSEKELFSERDDLLIGPPSNSRWSYACSKLLDEFFLMAFHRDKGLRGTVVRLFNTVGPRQTGRYGMVLPRFVSCALKGSPLQVYGSGKQTRCFCHVFDTVRALMAVAGEAATEGLVLNIGNTRSVSIEELAHMVIARTGSSSSIERIPYEKAYESGFEDMLRRAPDISAIGEAVGWSPEISLERIIDDVVAFMRSKESRD